MLDFPCAYDNLWDEGCWSVDPKALENLTSYYRFTDMPVNLAEDQLVHCAYKPSADYYNANQRETIWWCKQTGALHYLLQQTGGTFEDQYYWDLKIFPDSGGREAFWKAARALIVPRSWDSPRALQKLRLRGLADARLTEDVWRARVPEALFGGPIPLEFDYGWRRYFAVNVKGGTVGRGKRWVYFVPSELAKGHVTLSVLMGRLLKLDGCTLVPPISTLEEITPYLKPRSFTGKGSIPTANIIQVFGRAAICKCRKKKCSRKHASK